jgi:hypothetical protein
MSCINLCGEPFLGKLIIWFELHIKYMNPNQIETFITIFHLDSKYQIDKNLLSIFRDEIWPSNYAFILYSWCNECTEKSTSRSLVTYFLSTLKFELLNFTLKYYMYNITSEIPQLPVCSTTHFILSSEVLTAHKEYYIMKEIMMYLALR